MATLKILGMRVNVTLSDIASTVSGERTKEIFCPNYKYYENGASTLNKSTYYSGMLNRTCFSLAGLKSEDLLLQIKPIALVFDGKPEEITIEIITNRLFHDRSTQTQSFFGNIGSSGFTFLSDNEISLSGIYLYDTENDQYNSIGSFGYLGFQIFSNSISSVPIAEIGYFS